MVKGPQKAQNPSRAPIFGNKLLKHRFRTGTTGVKHRSNICNQGLLSQIKSITKIKIMGCKILTFILKELGTLVWGIYNA